MVQKHWTRGVIWGLVLLVGSAPLTHADLFDTLQRAVPTQIGQLDTTGISLQGGANLQGGVGGRTVTLLRARGQAGGTCGAFNFATSIQQAFEELPTLLEELGKALLANMPMLVLCYASPTLCDLYKHFQALVNATLQARYAQCEQMQQAAAALGLRLRGGEIAQCLEAEQEKGTALTVAMDRCLGEVRDVRSPSGERQEEVHLVKETLEAAGASKLTQTLAQDLLGDLVLRAQGGRLGTAQAHPVNSLQQRYEDYRQGLVAQLDEAADLLHDGQPLPPELLQALSWPGHPMPYASLQALAALKADPLRYWNYREKLASGLALARTAWEIQELDEQLATAAAMNPNLSDAQREALREQLATLRRKLSRLEAEKVLTEQHILPVLDALLREQRQLEQAAVRFGRQAPRGTPPPLPLERATPWGYQP